MSDHRLARATAGFTFILPLLLPPLTGFSVDRSTDVPSFQRCFSYLETLSLSFSASSLSPSVSLCYSASAFLPPSLFEFTVLLPDRPGRLRRTFHVNFLCTLSHSFRLEYRFLVFFFFVSCLFLRESCWNVVSDRS